MSNATTYTVRIDDDKAGGRLDKVLAGAIAELSRSRIQALLTQGQVLVDETIVTDGATRTKAGDLYLVNVPPPVPAEPVARDLPLAVVYEDEHLIVIDKPAGMVVHPAAGHTDDTLVNALLHHCRGGLSGIGGVTRPGIVHRLDKDTSGLLVVAKDDVTHRGLAEQFAAHTIQRAYLALVWGRPSRRRGSIEGNIGRSSKNRKKMAVLRRGGKPARTHYRLLKAHGNLVSLVECRLETGRTHQIRVHLTSIGHPVVGDPIYGGGPRRIPKEDELHLDEYLTHKNGQILHAYQLGFMHPIQQKAMEFRSEKNSKINELLTLLDEV